MDQYLKALVPVTTDLINAEMDKDILSHLDPGGNSN